MISTSCSSAIAMSTPRTMTPTSPANSRQPCNGFGTWMCIMPPGPPNQHCRGKTNPAAGAGKNRRTLSIDDDRVTHAHLLVQEVAAVGLVCSRRRDECDGARLVRAKFDLVADRPTSEDPRVLEETGRGEIVTAPRTIGENQGDRPAGGKVDRLRTEAETVDVDHQLRRSLGQSRRPEGQEQGRGPGGTGKTHRNPPFDLGARR